MSLPCYINYTKRCISDTDKDEWEEIGEQGYIIAAKANDNQYPFITKIKFTTGSGENFLKSTRLLIKVLTCSDITNPHYLACNGYLSTEDYSTVSDIFDIDPYYLNAYGPGAKLAKNKLASSPPYTDASGSTTTSAVSCRDGSELYFSFQTSELKPNKSYFLYFIRQTSYYRGYFEAIIQDIEVEYDQAIQLSTPTILTNNGLITPNSASELTFSWTSISNATSYKIWAKDDQGNYILNETTTTSTSYKITISNPLAYRGREIIAYVEAQGSGIYFNSSYSNKTIAKINNLPNKPSITEIQGGTNLTSQNSLIFSVSTGLDSDDQNCSLYFSLDNGVTKTLFVSTIVISSTTTGGGGVKPGENTISFYTYDELEYSGQTDSSFTATFGPVIADVQHNPKYVTSMSGTENFYIKYSDFTFIMSSGMAKKVQVSIKIGPTEDIDDSKAFILPEEYYTYQETTRTLRFSPIELPTSMLDYGAFYQLRFRVSDDNGATFSDYTNWRGVRRRIGFPRVPYYYGYRNDKDDSYDAIAKDDYFKNKISISVRPAEEFAAYAKISSIAIIVNYNNSSKEYNFAENQLTYENGPYEIDLDLSAINQNTKATFKFKVVDEAGQEKIGEVFLTLTKTSNLVFAGKDVSVSNENLKPMSNTEDFKITHPLAQATGTESINFIYKLQVGNKSKNIEKFTSLTQTDLVTITIKKNDINNIVKELASNFNSVFNSSITVIAADGFGTTVQLIKTFKVNFTEPPRFQATDPQFRIKHEYYSRTISPIHTGVPKLGFEIYNDSTNDLRMVNYKEGIIFILPKAEDPNNDIKEYRIYAARNDFLGDEYILSSDSELINYDQLLITIPYTTLKQFEQDLADTGDMGDGNFYYRYTAPIYTKNEYAYFKLYVVDNADNYSEGLVCPQHIIMCRTVTPRFAIENLDIKRNGQNVSLEYNFKITDLGGSATKEGWNRQFYDNYPNFDRIFNKYTPEASLTVEISATQDFKENLIQSSPIIYTPSGGEKLADFVYNQGTKLSGFLESNKKIYVRFILKVSYGLKNSTTKDWVTSEPQVHTYFGSVPTVAHRVHKVGINTTSLGENDVFVVENYSGTRYVRFKGTEASNAAKTYEITFDLLNGTITGAVINCGTWD